MLRIVATVCLVLRASACAHAFSPPARDCKHAPALFFAPDYCPLRMVSGQLSQSASLRKFYRMSPNACHTISFHRFNVPSRQCPGFVLSSESAGNTFASPISRNHFWLSKSKPCPIRSRSDSVEFGGEQQEPIDIFSQLTQPEKDISIAAPPSAARPTKHPNARYHRRAAMTTVLTAVGLAAVGHANIPPAAADTAAAAAAEVEEESAEEETPTTVEIPLQKCGPAYCATYRHVRPAQPLTSALPLHRHMRAPPCARAAAPPPLRVGRMLHAIRGRGLETCPADVIMDVIAVVPRGRDHVRGRDHGRDPVRGRDRGRVLQARYGRLTGVRRRAAAARRRAAASAGSSSGALSTPGAHGPARPGPSRPETDRSGPAVAPHANLAGPARACSRPWTGPGLLSPVTASVQPPCTEEDVTGLRHPLPPPCTET
jgi:hypothetical protein